MKRVDVSDERGEGVAECVGKKSSALDGFEKLDERVGSGRGPNWGEGVRKNSETGGSGGNAERLALAALLSDGDGDLE